MHAQQVFRRIVVKLQLTLVRMMDCFTDTAREMNVGGGDQHFVIFYLHGHDPFQRVLGFFLFLYVLYQMHDFIPVRVEEFTVQGQESSRVLILNALAGRTVVLMRIDWRGKPLPPAFVKYRAAKRTNGGFGELAFDLIGVVNLFLENTVMPCNLMKTRMRVFCAHDKSLLLLQRFQFE
jgi:hypothetical protein